MDGLASLFLVLGFSFGISSCADLTLGKTPFSNPPIKENKGKSTEEKAQIIVHTPIIEDKSFRELKKIALTQEGVIETQFGSITVDSEPMSRAALKTKNNIDHKFGRKERELAIEAVRISGKYKVVSLDAPVGENSEITVRFLVPEKYAQLAYGLKLLFGEVKRKVIDPTYSIVFFTDDAFEANKKIKDVREKDVIIRLWMGRKRGEQVKICRNSTYLGEGKKGVFQFEDWRVKAIDKEGIFLHAP